MARRWLIVNADDFGASAGINRGILEAHHEGIVTSTSLMVDQPAAVGAVELAGGAPELSVGLHFEWPDDTPVDGGTARREVERQIARFRELLGREPTHLDSHHHVHRDPAIAEPLTALADELGVPLRNHSQIVYIGGFYAQWEWEVTELHYVSVEFLEQILTEEVRSEWTEIGCHPGYVGDGFQSVYLTEREAELRTLRDPRVRETIERLDLRLCGFDAYPRGATSTQA